MSNSLLEDCAHDNARTTPGQTTGNCAVPKQYVHLHAEDAVLVTSWSQLGDDRYALTVRWPESATETDGASYDPRLLTQTLRQCCLLIAHAERAVPLDHQTLMDRMDFSIAQDLRVPRNAPAELSVTLACRSTGRRSMFVEMTLTHAGRQVAQSVIEFSWISPPVYSRLRGRHLHTPWGQDPVPGPAPAHLVGRASASDIVLAPTDRPDRWQLRVDVSNTGLYDHPVDHVPGLVLIEAAYQAAHALTGPHAALPRTVTTAYDQYIEFGEPCWIEAAVTSTAEPGRDVIEVTGSQGGRTAFRMTLA